MKTIVKGFWRFGVATKGTWHEVRDGNLRSAQIACPKCNKIMSLDNHSISPDGVVTPRLVCPKSSCSFSEDVVLDAWNA